MNKVTIIHLAVAGTVTACGIEFFGGIAAAHGLKPVTCIRCKRTRVFQRLRDANTAKRSGKPNAVQQRLFE